MSEVEKLLKEWHNPLGVQDVCFAIEVIQALEAKVNELETMQESITEFHLKWGLSTDIIYGYNARKFIGNLEGKEGNHE